MKSKQGDITDDLLHANIGVENVHVDIPKGFDQYSKVVRKKCMKFKNTIYGLHHIPCTFWNYLTKKLKACGLKQS